MLQRSLLLALVLSLTAVVATSHRSAPAGGQEPAEPRPEWIWSNATPKDGEQAWLRRAFDVKSVEGATLRGACDNRVQVFLNGEAVAVGGKWWRPFEVDVKEGLRAGTNVLAAHCTNEGGPAGLWLELVAKVDGGMTRVATDGTWLARRWPVDDWLAAEPDPRGWSAAHSFGPVGMQPWGQPAPAASDEAAPADDAEALDGDALELPEGFRAERLYSIPKSTQGSWVVLTFDGRGRILASDQYGALYRVTPPAVGATLEESDVERVDVEIGRAQGLCWAFDSLYVVVAERGGPVPQGLYRVSDTDGDDRLDDVRQLALFDGSGEHGPHAVRVTPDGESLYVLAGNHTRLPEGVNASRVTRAWGEDQLLPRLPDPNGHAAGVLAPGGWLCRTDPEGREWELVACGMRNAYDFDTDARGEVFTFDSDMEWDTGLPWYRPTRILHLVSGADYGWRHGSGKWPASYPDSLPAVVDIGLSSPTGVVFGARTQFPEPYRSALYAADWTYGTVYAVHLEPDGATYFGRAEPFLRGKPFPVTDLAVGPDGALYVTTGGRRTQSGLYRVRWVGSEEFAATLPAPDPQPEPEAAALRRSLEALHGEPVGLAGLAAAWPALGHADRFVRYAARTIVEQADPATWTRAALEEEGSARAALEALVALARVGAADHADAIVDSLLRLDLANLPDAELVAAVRVYGLVAARMGGVDPERAAALAARLDPLLPTGRAPIDHELARILVHLRSPGVVPKALALLESAVTQEDAVHYALVLREARAGWTPTARRAYFDWLDGDASRLAGGNSFAKYLRRIREDALANVPEEVRERFEAVLSAEDAERARPVEAVARTFVRKWARADLEPHLGRLSSGRSFPRGEAAYEAATCFQCHRIAGEGGATGPDLTGAASRFSPRDLLETLLEPSSTISDQYQDTELVLDDDELVVGRVLSEDDHVIELLTMPPEEETMTLDKAVIVSRRPHAFSRMPSGLLDTLELEEVLDLLAYVLAGGDATAPAFR